MEQDLSLILSRSQLEQKQSINPFQKLSELVYETLEDAIINCQLKPGAQLNTVKIAQILNISRTPVTDALERLVEAGLVVNSTSKKGYYVFDISEALLEYLLGARNAIENYTAYYCAMRSSKIDLKRMRLLAQQFSKALNTWNSTGFSQIDCSFHRLIVDSCGNPILQSMYGRMERLISYSSHRVEDYMRTKKQSELLMRSENQHQAIYNAIALGLPDAAFAASRQHLDTCLTASIRGLNSVGKELLE